MKKRSFLRLVGLTLLGFTGLGRDKAYALNKVSSQKADVISENSQTNTSFVIQRNEEAVNNIIASKKHYDMVAQGWGTQCKTNLFTLAHLSDIHTDETRLGNFQQFVDGVDYIDAAIGTGDFVIKGVDEQFAFLNHVTFKKDFLKVVGNHERVANDNATRAYVYEKLGMHTNTGKLYYYKDFEKHKIRIIVLNQFDIDRTHDINCHIEHYSQEQIDWFVEVLRDAKNKDYAVAIGMHTPNMDALPEKNNRGFYQRRYICEKLMISYINAPIIEDIVNAFKHGIAINRNYTFSDVPDMKVLVNTSFTGKGTFIAYLVGHKHGDFMGYSKFYPDQLYLLMNVSSSTPEFAQYSYGEEVSDLPRVNGSQTEDCFNVYSFDLRNKIVKVVRVGSSVNDLMQDRKKTFFPFEGINE